MSEKQINAAKDLELKKLAFLELGKKDEKNTSAAVTETKAVSANDDEPLLRENPGRFVMFPLKYHEVRVRRVHAYMRTC